jgi:polyhydroxyalkanoate synthesis regulator phasin
MDSPKETLQRAMMFAIGAAYTTAEGIRGFVEDMVKQGSLTKTDASSLVDELVEKGKQARTNINQSIAKSVSDYMKSAGLATKEDIEKLNARVQQLEQQRAVK